MQVYGVGINFLDETQPLQSMPSWVRECLGSALGDEFTELLVTEYRVGDAQPPHIDQSMWGPKIVGLSLVSAVSLYCHDLQHLATKPFPHVCAGCARH
jgi:alkylated DNA repair dioxygenase AlkB